MKDYTVVANLGDSDPYVCIEGPNGKYSRITLNSEDGEVYLSASHFVDGSTFLLCDKATTFPTKELIQILIEDFVDPYA